MKGFVLTLDSIISMLLMVSIISLLIFFRTESTSSFFTAQQLHSLSEDSLNILSKSTLREVITNKTLIEGYINSGMLDVSDWDKKAIDVIGMLWAEDNASSDMAAENITKDILGDILPYSIGYQFLINDDPIYNSSDTPRPSESDSEAGISAGRIASGYESNKTVSGCVAMAYLTTIKGKRDSSYVYFGGYVGDGNIKTNIFLPSYDKILEAYMEMDVGKNFTLYINGNYSGVYKNGTAGGGLMRADKWYLNNTNLTFFHPGENVLEINFTNRSYIGGGYLRVTYNTTELAPSEQLGYEKKRLPGIDGVINLYDSFYIPGNLSAMNITLNLKSNESVFMNIGNTTVYYDNVSTNISDSVLSGLLDYDFLSKKTIPIRIGHYALNETDKYGNISDVFLTTSLVSDMLIEDIPNETVNISRITAAKEVDKIFVDAVLNSTGSRVGLVSYWSSVPTNAITPLTDNETILVNDINGYTAKIGQGQRHLCAAIKEAKIRLTDPLRKRYIVVMSDGSAEKKPGCLETNLCPYANYSNISENGAAAVNEAYDAYLKGITVYSIGFGLTADNDLLRQIAACGGGKWNSSLNYSDLIELYKNFAFEISKQSVIFEYQAVVSSLFNSTLFSDSYIEYNYTPSIVPYDYGEISLKAEGKNIGNYSGDTIDAPCKQGFYHFSPYVKVVDARMTSYSSSYWTDRLSVNSSNTSWNWTTVYNLSDFGNTYLTLGDPYTVEIPANLITSGNDTSGDNYFCIGSGSNVSNAIGGSPDDRLIYTLRFKSSVPYGSLNETCEAAEADAIGRLIDNIKDYIDPGQIQNNTNSISKVPYMWGPANIRIRVWS